MIARRIAAPPEVVIAAAAAPITTRFAEPGRPQIDRGTITWTSDPDVAREVERYAEVTPDGDGSRMSLGARVTFELPYFGWLFRPLVSRAVRRSLQHIAEVLEARAVGAPEPEIRRPFWAGRDPILPRQAATIAAVCAVLLVAGYCGSLFTQALDYLATSFDASDADLGVALAATRIGVLVGLVGSILADRRGRRRILIVALAGVCATTALSALAPNLVAFGALQVFVRGFVQLAGIVGYVAVMEEAPEGSRTFLLAIAGMATGAGFALGAGLLPVAEIATGAWRMLFVLGGFGLLLLPGLARRLPETERYASMSARAKGASAHELVDPIYGGRFVITAALGFLLGFFGSPSLQFTNRYLSDVRGYSAAGIVWLRGVTQGLPGLVGILIGGRLAESRGRKPIAARATLVLGVTSAVFFLTGGVTLWAAMLVATIAGAMSGPAITAFNTELFPTEVRGRAGASLLAISVIGAASGLLLVGYLADPLGDVGKAVALTAIAPIAVALFLIPRLPEGRGRALDDLSPPEV